MLWKNIFYVLSNALQAMGAATQALIINLSRQGIIYIPALFLLEVVLSSAVVFFLYLGTQRSMERGEQTEWKRACGEA